MQIGPTSSEHLCQYVDQIYRESINLASVGTEDGDLSNKDSRTADALEIEKTLQKCHVGIRASSSQKVAGPAARVKQFSNDAHSMGYKLEELEVIL